MVILILILFINLGLLHQGVDLLNWMHTHRLVRLLFVRRTENGSRGCPVRASFEWLLYEEVRVYLTRFLSNSSSPTSQRPNRRLYSNIFRRALKTFTGTYFVHSNLIEFSL